MNKKHSNNPFFLCVCRPLNALRQGMTQKVSCFCSDKNKSLCVGCASFPLLLLYFFLMTVWSLKISPFGVRHCLQFVAPTKNNHVQSGLFFRTKICLIKLIDARLHCIIWSAFLTARRESGLSEHQMDLPTCTSRFQRVCPLHVCDKQGPQSQHACPARTHADTHA